MALALVSCGSGPIANDGGTTSSRTTSSMSSESSSSSDSSGTDDAQSTDTETSADPCPDDGCLDMEPPECDPFAQDCPPGEKCVPWTSNGGNCVPILGDAAVGEPCSGLGFDDCDATSVCVGGICQPLCTGDEQMPSCPQGYACSLPDYGSPLCVQPCHPLTESCAASELACMWTGALFGCIGTADAQAPTGQHCSDSTECASGVCLGWDINVNCPFDAGGCCTDFCALSAGDGPCQVTNPNHTCEPFFVELPPGYEDVGICIP
jgi:hypothetical protein